MMQSYQSFLKGPKKHRHCLLGRKCLMNKQKSPKKKKIHMPKWYILGQLILNYCTMKEINRAVQWRITKEDLLERVVREAPLRSDI